LALAKAGFTLGIRPVSSLLPHEETIPANVERIASEMKRDGVQKDPIIIDGGTATILDGMHRLAAFLKLGIENAVCCAVDYSSRSISIGRWARVYSLGGADSLDGLLSPAGITRRTTLAEAFSALETREAAMAAFTSEAAYLPEGNMDFSLAQGTLTALDRLAATRGFGREFVSEEDVDIPLQSGKNVVVLLRRLGKDDVITAARTGKLFPCKTSMHRIDPRPVAVDFPIGELGRATTEMLRQRLAGRKEILLAPETIYEGRRYKERLLLLNQD
jgi:ParB/Sulfiredoxin domain